MGSEKSWGELEALGVDVARAKTFMESGPAVDYSFDDPGMSADHFESQLAEARSRGLKPGDIDPLTGLRILPFDHLINSAEMSSKGVPADLSTRIDEYLAESWAEAIEADR